MVSYLGLIGCSRTTFGAFQSFFAFDTAIWDPLRHRHRFLLRFLRGLLNLFLFLLNGLHLSLLLSLNGFDLSVLLIFEIL